MLRIADADVLPLQFDDAAQTVDGYLHELHKLLDDKRKHAADARGAARGAGVRARERPDAARGGARQRVRRCRS